MGASPDLVVFVVEGVMVVAGRLAGGVELDGAGWVCVWWWWSRGEEGGAKRGRGRAEEQAGNAYPTNMLCACVHHGLHCLRDGTHKSTKSHQRQDHQYVEKKKRGASKKNLCCLNMKAQSCIAVCFFMKRLSPALLEQCTAWASMCILEALSC